MSSESPKTINAWYEKNRSLVLRQTPFWAQAFTALLISLGSFVFLIAFFTKIDEVISVQGKLESNIGRKDVESPVGGKVDKIYVKDGDFVKAGDRILKFDTKEALSEKDAVLKNISIEDQTLSNSVNLIDKKKKLISQKLSTTSQIVESLSSLVVEGGFQKVQYLEQLDKKYQLETELNSILIEEKNVKLNHSKSINELELRLRKINLLLNNQNLISPSTGIVFNPMVGEQGVISAGSTIMSIIPQKGLKANVWVSNKDIGLVSTSLPVRMRVDAFPYTKYGELTGKITRIGADVIAPDKEVNAYRFPVEISLDKSYLENKNRKVMLRSGMSIQANLKLREKRVISLLSDLLVTQSDSVQKIRQQ